MRLIIAGGRDYELTRDDFLKLEAIEGVTEVVSGCCGGVDRDGELWALDFQIPIARFPADWLKHGKAAGPIRNRAMAEYADAVALFPGGKGTASMHQEAVKAGLRIFDFRAAHNP